LQGKTAVLLTEYSRSS